MSTLTSRTDTIRLRSRIPTQPVGGVVDTLRLSGRVALIDHAPEPKAIEEAVSLDLAPDLQLIVPQPTRAQRVTVRVFDLTVAVVGIIVLTPLMLLVALAVMLDSPGPIFYGSPRVGHAKPVFRAWKFRSMRPDADAHLAEVLDTDEEARDEYLTYHKLRNDPRLTRVGAVIRQTSLDELPQLFNILVGQMSVVGPRPKLTQDAESYGEALAAVLTVKPGLTGLWQVSGRNRLPVADRVTLDIEYVTSRTLFGDLHICVRTFVQLWQPRKNGAY